MSQFLGVAIFLIVIGGLVLHSGLEMPWYLDWIGKLPGDIIVKKGNVVFYVPVTSSVLMSICLSFFFSLFSGKRN